MRAFVEALGERVAEMAAGRGVSHQVVQDGTGAERDRELLVAADPDRMTPAADDLHRQRDINHSPPNGTVQLVVRPIVESGKAAYRVEVVDQGPGVPLEERDRIFEPFAKIAGRRRESGTTGLGLAIARILAARQDATLRVDDAKGGGAVLQRVTARGSWTA